jgi:hypothetical protein
MFSHDSKGDSSALKRVVTLGTVLAFFPLFPNLHHSLRIPLIDTPYILYYHINHQKQLPSTLFTYYLIEMRLSIALVAVLAQFASATFVHKPQPPVCGTTTITEVCKTATK